jgi:outer membrane protein OmpA-like peptidoglycan-associated protein
MKALALLAVVLGARLALADPIDVQLSSAAIAGKAKPSLTIVAEVPARRIRLRLKRHGCGPDAKLEQSLDHLDPGQSHRFELDQPVGRCDWTGTIDAVFGGEDGALPLEFSTELAGALEVRPDPARFDAKAHTLVVTFNREADRGSVEAFGESGQRLGLVENQELGGTKAGDPLTLTYEDQGQPALKLHVTVYDPNGLFAGVDLFPWSMKVPHAEVNFASGSAEIQPSEQPKLKESAARIAEALARAGQVAPLRLFIAGYTDTVGSTESNRTLSSQRAQSIARYFRGHGINVAILTAGLGEDALLVGTPDETPEVRNRRAEYILAVDPPPIEKAARQPSWTPLGT